VFDWEEPTHRAGQKRGIRKENRITTKTDLIFTSPVLRKLSMSDQTSGSERQEKRRRRKG
jgi:hypothetical protein